jgi:hypothetical protein
VGNVAAARAVELVLQLRGERGTLAVQGQLIEAKGCLHSAIAVHFLAHRRSLRRCYSRDRSSCALDRMQEERRSIT